LLDANDLNRGFDAQTGEYVNMVKAGIIDPTKHRRVVDFMRPRRRFCAPATKRRPSFKQASPTDHSALASYARCRPRISRG